MAAEEINKVLFIIGSTSVGKSSLALKLAKKLNGEIISADSMQVYKGMDIGTAKPSKKELSSIRHHLIDIVRPDEPWSVSDFVKKTTEAAKEILDKGKLPIIVGGTGLYINSLLEGYSFPEIRKDDKVRRMLQEEARLYGSPLLHGRLMDVDPKTAEKIHPNDTKRIIRALEVYEITGKPMSELKSKGVPVLPYKKVVIGLKMKTPSLYKRIEERVDDMLKAGLVKEVNRLLKKGCSRNLNSMQAIGYKEVIVYLDGKCSYDEMVSKLKQNTRNFAKRQMTWFKRFKRVKWFDVEKTKITDIIKKVKEEIKCRL